MKFPATRPGPSRRIPVAVFTAIALTLLAAGYWYYRKEAQDLHREKNEELAAIGTLKSGQVQQWRKERLADARRFAGGPLLSRVAAEFLRDPGSPEHRSELMKQLMLDRMGDQYHEVLLFTPDGRIALGTENAPAPVNPSTRRLVEASLASDKPLLSDFFLEPGGIVHIDAAGAVRNAEGHPLAVLVLRCHADAYLFPLIQSWPTPSPSAETLLVQRDGDEVLYLNQLRHGANTATALRVPLGSAGLVEAQALLGRRGECHGRDYRNVEVLADLRPIPDSPWFMVAKVDAGEILSEARYRAGMISLMVSSLILLAAVATAYVYRHQQADVFRELYDSERQRREARKTIRATLYNLGEGVISTDREGLVRELNPAAEKLTGWSEAEAQGRPLEQVFRAIREDTRATVEDPVDQVLRTDSAVALEDHTLLIARDGSERCIAFSAAPIRDDGGAISDVVLVFSDRTVERSAQAELKRNEQRLRTIIEAEPECVKLVDPRGILVDMNPAGLAMLEAGSLREVQDRGLIDFIRPEHQAAFRNLHTRVMDGESGTLEFEVAGLKGARRWLETHAVPIRGANGKVSMLLGITRDITERRAAEEGLLQRSRQLAVLSEASARINTVLEAPAVLRQLVTTAMELTGATDGTAARFLDGRMVFREYNLHGKWMPIEFEFEPGYGVPGWVIQVRAPYMTNDAEHDPHVIPENQKALGFHNLADVPIFNRQGALLGCFEIHNKPGGFTDADLSMLEGLAASAAIALENSGLLADRKLAEEALRRSETKFRTLFNSSPDGVMLLDERGFFDCNQVALETFGCASLEEFCSKHPWDLSPEFQPNGVDSLTLAKERIATAMETGYQRFEWVHKRADTGATFPAEVLLNSLELGGRRVLQAVVRDISERRNAEKALIESHERFELANRATFNVIWDWDLREDTFWRNDNFEKMFGYSRNEMEAGYQSSASRIHPEDLASVDAGLRVALKNRKSMFWADQYRFRRKDGSYATVEDRAIITRDADGLAVRMLGAMQDISERKQAERALRENENRLRMIIEHSTQLFFSHTPENLLTYVSPQIETFLDIAPDDTFRPWTEFLTDNPANAIGRDLTRAAIETGERQRPYELELRSNRGRKLWVEVHETPVVEQGKTIAMVGALTDITESKRAHDQLVLQSSALEASANAIVITDHQGSIEWVNPAFTKITGYGLAEAVGKRTGDLIRSGKHDQAFYRTLWDTILAGDVWHGEIINRRKDGSLYTEDMTITPLKDDRGGITHFLAVKQDITERVEAERNLQQYTERLEAMREIDAALLGARSTTELARGALNRLRHIVPFERAALVLFVGGMTEGTILAVDQDKPWLPLAGETRPIGDFHDPRDLLAAPFLDLSDLSDIQGCAMEELMLSQGLRNLVYIPMESEGAILGFVALSTTTPGTLTPQHAEIALDMTDQLVVAIQHTRLREELELSNQQLESKVEMRTADLRTTVATMRTLEGELRQREAEARAASEAKSRFLASMSHELRTPLIGVTGMLEVLTQSDLDAEQRQVVAIIHESSESLLQIIGDILDFSKIEANKLELTSQTFSARALVESVSQIFKSAISNKGLRFDLEVDPRLSPAHVGDALRIRQILNNFLSNAVKFTERGSITLRIRAVDSKNGYESLAFEVQDTGIGVSPESQANLFEPFTQAEASTTRRFGGTGLGLVICRRLAALMGGSLTMQSALQQGTTLTLAVDLAVGDARDIEKADLLDPSRAIGTRPAPSIEAAEKERSLVLMAEDHPTNRMVLTQQVNRAGFALEIAVDGQEAFDKWQSGRFALILTDLHMPRMDGYQLTKAVRNWEHAHGSPRTPILALTANAVGGEASRCVELGMDDYLIKPVTIPLLASKLHRWMPHVKSGGVQALHATSVEPASRSMDRAQGMDFNRLLDLCRGDAAGAQEILEDFIEATATDLRSMQDGLKQKDRSSIQRQSHRIKGSSAMIGARDLADRATKLEADTMAEPAEWESIRNQIAGMQEALKALERAE